MEGEREVKIEVAESRLDKVGRLTVQRVNVGSIVLGGSSSIKDWNYDVGSSSRYSTLARPITIGQEAIMC